MSAQHRSFYLTRGASLVVALIIISGCGLGAVPTASPTPTRTPMQQNESPTVPVSVTAVPNTPPIATPSTPAAGTHRVTQFGLLTVLPESSGSMSTPKVIEATASTGVRYMRVALDWAISEPEPGQITFNSRNDAVIQDIEAAGLRVLPTLYVGRGWMNNNPPGRQEGGSRSYPPKDLNSTWDDNDGYSTSYYRFVYEFFSHYRGHFDYVAIENEANSKLFWGGTAEEYVRLLQTAYLALKAADPQVIIADSGFVSTAIGSCILDDYLKNGGKSDDELLEFASYYEAARRGNTIETIEQLKRVIAQPRVQEQCERINYMLDHMGNAVDVVNFHFYEDYRALPTVAAWLRQRTSAAGYNPGLISNEMGTRNQGSDFAQSQEYAQEIFKKMITSISLNLQVVVWFSADTVQAGKDKVGLFDETGRMRPAGNTLKLVIATLEPHYRFRQAVSIGPTEYRYIFEDIQGIPSLESLWLEKSQQWTVLVAPAGAQEALTRDYRGEEAALAITNGQIELPFGSAPLFIIWK